MMSRSGPEFEGVEPLYHNPGFTPELNLWASLLKAAPEFDLGTLEPAESLIVHTSEGSFEFAMVTPGNTRTAHMVEILSSSIDNLEPGEIVRLDGAGRIGGGTVGTICRFAPIIYSKLPRQEVTAEHLEDFTADYIANLIQKGILKIDKNGQYYTELWDGYWRTTMPVQQAFRLKEAQTPKVVF